MKSRSCNKKIGTDFEKEICAYLAKNGWWVHFIAPAANGGQPFDIVAVKFGHALAADCKTSVSKRFPYSRLEDNQKLAFERWIKCGNEMPMIFVKYDNKVYKIPFDVLKKMEVIDLEEFTPIYKV